MLKDENLYLVGGIVRDQILNRANFDIDYCYEGNAIEFAKHQGLNIIKENLQFGTVRVLKNDKLIDIASTRKEIYPKKGHLPKIEEIGCSILEDSYRRDFSINALYKRTTDGKIFDFHNGLHDISNKLIRVLHDNSFIDDPTRILRALKFSIRFNFQLEENTLNFQNDYINNINYDMSYHRLKKELVETFNLNQQVILDIFINNRIYYLLSPNKTIMNSAFNTIQEVLKEYTGEYTWLIYLSSFCLDNIELTRKEKKIIEWANRLLRENSNNNTPVESILINKIRCK